MDFSLLEIFAATDFVLVEAAGFRAATPEEPVEVICDCSLLKLELADFVHSGRWKYLTFTGLCLRWHIWFRCIIYDEDSFCLWVSNSSFSFNFETFFFLFPDRTLSWGGHVVTLTNFSYWIFLAIFVVMSLFSSPTTSFTTITYILAVAKPLTFEAA